MYKKKEKNVSMYNRLIIIVKVLVSNKLYCCKIKMNYNIYMYIAVIEHIYYMYFMLYICD